MDLALHHSLGHQLCCHTGALEMHARARRACSAADLSWPAAQHPVLTAKPMQLAAMGLANGHGRAQPELRCKHIRAAHLEPRAADSGGTLHLAVGAGAGNQLHTSARAAQPDNVWKVANLCSNKPALASKARGSAGQHALTHYRAREPPFLSRACMPVAVCVSKCGRCTAVLDYPSLSHLLGSCPCLPACSGDWCRCWHCRRP